MFNTRVDSLLPYSLLVSSVSIVRIYNSDNAFSGLLSWIFYIFIIIIEFVPVNFNWKGFNFL